VARSKKERRVPAAVAAHAAEPPPSPPNRGWLVAAVSLTVAWVFVLLILVFTSAKPPVAPPEQDSRVNAPADLK
jgi:hypothetical protein